MVHFLSPTWLLRRQRSCLIFQMERWRALMKDIPQKVKCLIWTSLKVRRPFSSCSKCFSNFFTPASSSAIIQIFELSEFQLIQIYEVASAKLKTQISLIIFFIFVKLFRAMGKAQEKNIHVCVFLLLYFVFSMFNFYFTDSSCDLRLTHILTFDVLPYNFNCLCANFHFVVNNF